MRDVGILLVDFYEARGFVEQRTGALQLGFHVGEHLRDGREADDGFAELGTLVGVFKRFAVGGFARADRLRADTQAGGVHQRHHILYETHLAVADQLGRCVGKDQFARGRAFDT